MTPAVICALVVVSESVVAKVVARMDGMRSVLVDVEVAVPGPCMELEPRDGFTDL